MLAGAIFCDAQGPDLQAGRLAIEGPRRASINADQLLPATTLVRPPASKWRPTRWQTGRNEA